MIEVGKVATRFVGEYNAETEYLPADVVSFGGNSYASRKACVGILPTDAEYWQPFGSAIATEDSVGLVKPDNETINVAEDGTLSMLNAIVTDDITKRKYKLGIDNGAMYYQEVSE